MIEGSYGWIFNINILKCQLSSGVIRNFYNGFDTGVLYIAACVRASLESLSALFSGCGTSGVAKVYYK